MQSRRYITFAVGAIANGVTQAFAPLTNDDNHDRHLTGIYVSDHTALIQIQALNAGKNFATIDDSAFNSTQGPLPLDEVVKANVGLQFAIFNGSGGNLAAGQAVVVQYEVVQGT